YDQVQRLLNRRLDTVSPQSSTNRVKREFDQLQILQTARKRASLAFGQDLHGAPIGPDPEFQAYLDDLIVRRRLLLEHAPGLIPDED
ncbi:MAG: hypothetical protein ACR2JK_02635, partial [Geodermatophilaceae bacterium]